MVIMRNMPAPSWPKRNKVFQVAQTDIGRQMPIRRPKIFGEAHGLRAACCRFHLHSLLCKPALVLLLTLQVLLTAISAEPLSHELRIVHPGDPERRNLRVVLEQHFDEAGEPMAYSTWVDSVICKEKTCEVVKVELHWDALGRYQRYKVAKGSKLTKLDHVPFTQADHAKLQRILLDKDSPLREVTKEGLTGPKPKLEEGIDAVTRPTVLTLKNSVVIGAGYSCYDLWHWANGEMAGIVRSLTGKSLSPGALEGLLSSQDDQAVAFALTQLGQRQLFSTQTVKRVVANIPAFHDDLVVPALGYLQAALPDEPKYYAKLAGVFEECGEEKRILILGLLAKNQAGFPKGALEQLSAALPKFNSHHELHLFLTLVTARQAGSETISRNVAHLLSHRKFFIARRAYWYLEKQDLPEEIQAKVDSFYHKFMDRL